MKNTTQLYAEIGKYTLTGKISVEEMNRIIYDKFKKRRIGLLDNFQLQTLLDEMKRIYEVRNGAVSFASLSDDQ